MSDVLRLRNLTFHAYHGLFPEEARLGQRFEVDVELHLDLAAAGAADDPARTVDYSEVGRVVEGVVTGRRFGLVEALAEAVAAAVLEGFHDPAGVALEAVRVRVRKPNPPVPLAFDGLEVEIERRPGAGSAGA